MGRRVGPKNKLKRSTGLMDRLKDLDYAPGVIQWTGYLLRRTGVLLLVLMVGFLSYDFYQFGMTSETFTIELNVEGNNQVPAEEVREALNPVLNREKGPGSLLSISAPEAKELLGERIPRFKDIYVLKKFPNQLVVKVKERSPVAIVARLDENQDRRVFLPADERGVIFEVRPGEWDRLKNTLPVIMGLEELPRDSQGFDRRWSRAMRVKKAFEKEFVPDMLNWIRIRPGGYAEVELDHSDSLVVKLGLSNYHEKFVRLDEMMMTEEFQSIDEYINLRDLDQILVR